MFIGEFQHSMDEKGRIIIPARFREKLGDRFVATKGLENCLFLYPLPEWTELEAKLRGLPFTRGDVRAFVRLFFSGATECEVDRQGRALIPVSLREYAQIEKDVVVIGISTRVEVWAKEEWLRYSREAEGAYEEIAEKMGTFGI